MYFQDLYFFKNPLKIANSTENTAKIDNRKGSKSKKSFASRLRSASPFHRRHSSKNKIPHHATSIDDSSFSSSRIGANPRSGENEIIRETMGTDYDTTNEMSVLVDIAGHEI